MEKKFNLGVVICAAGSSSRMGGTDKLALRLGEATVLESAAGAFLDCGFTRQLIIAASRENFDAISTMFGAEKARKTGVKITVCLGGETRQESVANALKALESDIDFVAVHDGARPFVTRELIEKTLAAAARSGAALPGLFAKETMHVVRGGEVVSTPDRAELFAAQTPQIFRKELLLRAYAAAERDGVTATDDCMLVSRVFTPGERCEAVSGDENNIKLTTPRDIPAAERISSEIGAGRMRVGCGYDVHRLVPDRRLVLGGVNIPFEKGLLGHSDADVLLHAVIDALLGAAGERDIGFHFPDSDEAYRGVSSLVLLEKTRVILRDKGYAVGNVDATVVCQAPRLSGHIGAMRENIAKALGIRAADVNIKGKTEEGLGFTGSGEGISAHAVCTILKF